MMWALLAVLAVCALVAAVWGLLALADLLGVMLDACDD